MTTAQIVFSIALGIITLAVLAFAVFVARSTMWGDRWVRAPRRSSSSNTSEGTES